MNFSALLAISALLAMGTLALNCKDGLNYCGRSIKLKEPERGEDYFNNDLVHCTESPDSLRRVEVCYGGCIEAPAGQSDYCAPFAGFIIATATDNCIEIASNAHRKSVKKAEKEPGSKREIRLLEADVEFFRWVSICLLGSAKANTGRSEWTAYDQTLKFYAKTTDRLNEELKELKKGKKN